VDQRELLISLSSQISIPLLMVLVGGITNILRPSEIRCQGPPRLSAT
jgi:hypothetical protein